MPVEEAVGAGQPVDLCDGRPVDTGQAPLVELRQHPVGDRRGALRSLPPQEGCTPGVGHAASPSERGAVERLAVTGSGPVDVHQ